MQFEVVVIPALLQKPVTNPCRQTTQQIIECSEDVLRMLYPCYRT